MRHLRLALGLLATLALPAARVAAPVLTSPTVTAAAASAAVATVVVVPEVALAGYTLDGANDRIDIGTIGGFGSQMKDADGWSLMCWLSTSQTSVATIMMSFTTGAQGAVNTANQSIWFSLAGYTSDIANDQDHVLINFGDFTDTGVLWHQELGAGTVSNGVLNHHAVTVIANGVGGGSNSSKSIIWYQNGVARTTWTKPFSDGLGTLSNFANTLAIGAERKNGGTWFDWTEGTFADCRVYTVALTAAEINDIYILRGRDTVVRSLTKRWPLQGACLETRSNDTCTPQNGPTLTTVNELYGTRRR